MRLGQVSAFVILALVIVVLIYVTRPGTLSGERIPVDTRDERTVVESIVNGCLEQTLKTGLVIAGEQGGFVYVEPFPGYVPDARGKWNVPLLYSDGINFLPSMEDVASYQLGRYIEEYLEGCTVDYGGLRNKLVLGAPDAKVDVQDHDVSVVLRLPITIMTTTGETKLSTFYSSTPSELLGMHHAADSLIYAHVDDVGHLGLTILDNSAYSPQVVPIYNDVLLTTLHSDTGLPRRFRYAAQLPSNFPPSLLLPGEIRLRPGESYGLLADDPDDEPITFTTTTSGFSVTEAGYLSTRLTGGRHTVTIFAHDPNAFYDQGSVEVIIG